MLFHVGGWAVAAYARGAKHARGAVIGQDIFESGASRRATASDLQNVIHAATLTLRSQITTLDIICTGLLPADSDYRMFSYKHYGSLPGLDIAFLLDGAAYHTDRDTLERLRPGTVQVGVHWLKTCSGNAGLEIYLGLERKLSSRLQRRHGWSHSWPQAK